MRRLRPLSLRQKLSVADAVAEPATAPDAPAGKLRVVLSRLKENEVNLLEEELGNPATLSNVVKGKDSPPRRLTADRSG